MMNESMESLDSYLLKLEHAIGFIEEHLTQDNFYVALMSSLMPRYIELFRADNPQDIYSTHESYRLAEKMYLEQQYKRLFKTLFKKQEEIK